MLCCVVWAKHGLPCTLLPLNMKEPSCPVYTIRGGSRNFLWGELTVMQATWPQKGEGVGGVWKLLPWYSLLLPTLAML